MTQIFKFEVFCVHHLGPEPEPKICLRLPPVTLGVVENRTGHTKIHSIYKKTRRNRKNIIKNVNSNTSVVANCLVIHLLYILAAMSGEDWENNNPAGVKSLLPNRNVDQIRFPSPKLYYVSVSYTFSV